MTLFRTTSLALALAASASVPAIHAQTAPTGAPPKPVATRAAATPRTGALTVPFTQFTLPNGLHVILHEDHTEIGRASCRERV